MPPRPSTRGPRSRGARRCRPRRNVFILTHRVEPGKLEAFKEYFATYCAEIVEPQEPRLHSFYGYAAAESDLVTIVQVHPDADSMATHLKVGAEHFGEAYAEYLEAGPELQIYGNLTEELIRTISTVAQLDGDDERVTIREPFTGFDRLPQR
ncbi:hypothetical protein [Kribbella sp. HUAS MG21]|uniref:Antibiotic biosynthesis monooxygenase n=1 Tax=Kribbella sp. HUAS MG21 TaxID=3160966 RepID=A0AAU7T7Q1_9ACTN